MTTQLRKTASGWWLLLISIPRTLACKLSKNRNGASTRIANKSEGKKQTNRGKRQREIWIQTGKIINLTCEESWMLRYFLGSIGLDDKRPVMMHMIWLWAWERRASSQLDISTAVSTAKMSNRNFWKRAQIKVGGFEPQRWVSSSYDDMNLVPHPQNLRPKAKLWTEPNGGYVVRCWGIAKFGVRWWKIARQGWWRLLCFGVPIAADKLGGLRRPWWR